MNEISAMSKKGYSSRPLSFNRKMVIASVANNRKNAIHCVTEIDISIAREKIRIHTEQTGTRLSLTGYIVKCLAETLTDYPELNAFRRRNRIIQLEDITISVLVEREIGGEKVPEPLAIHSADKKSLEQVTGEIREAQRHSGNQVGNLNNTSWIRFIPGFLLKSFVRVADRNIKMAKRYGKVAVTAVGMHSDSPLWFIPHGTATVMLTVGSILKKDGREFLCVTASFDHELIDGAPATRMMNSFMQVMQNGYLVDSPEA